MSNDLVRVRLERIDTNLSRIHAEEAGAQILDEPTRADDGRLRPPTRHGRPLKTKTSVAKKAAEKKEAAVTDPASNPKENQ